MGLELDIGCFACKNWLWLGSAKADKWHGFQLGNELFVDWLLLHAHAGEERAVLELWTRAGELAPWNVASNEWIEDERSLHSATWRSRSRGAAARVDLARLRWANAIYLSCERCQAEVRAGRIGDGAQLEQPDAVAEWVLDHVAPACALVVRLLRE